MTGRNPIVGATWAIIFTAAAIGAGLALWIAAGAMLGAAMVGV